MAARALQERGLSIVEMNYRCAEGEIDLVARDGDAWVFVEVKTRRGDRFGTPEEAVTPRKQAKLITVADNYLQTHNLGDADWRIDVVAIAMDAHGRLQRIDIIDHAVTH
ncbi:MAG: YraN family protein [Chloroflexi bacterium]|nr:YraN family protein [Chloroflexota bacterium]